MKTNKSKLYLWLVGFSLLLCCYGQSSFSAHKETAFKSRKVATPVSSFHENYSLKYPAEAGSFEGIQVSGRKINAEDKSKSYTKYILSHSSYDEFALLTSAYIHRFSFRTYFSTFLYLLYGVLII